MDFLNWYKNKVESARPEPPEGVWEEIQTQLDIDKVWTGIDKEMRAGKRRKLFSRMSVAASLLLILALGILLNSDAHRRNSLQSITDNIKIHPVSLDVPLKKQSLHTHLAGIQDLPEIKENKPDENIKSYPPVDRTIPAAEKISPLAYAHSKINLKEAVLISSLSPLSLNGETKESKVKVYPSGYYIGATGHLANTWLMNNKTLQGLRSEELTASLPSFGYNLGIIAGKNISNKFDIQAEVFFISHTRQSYNEYMHGQYINNNMQLNYLNLSVSARWHLTETERLGMHSLILGAHKGFLKNAFQDINGESVSLNNEYNSTDYGLVAGYEYQHPVGNGLSIGTGFQTRIGLNNIFAGNELIPDYLNITRNASLNLTLSIRYNSR